MILTFLKNALLTDVNNLFEDISVLEYLNEYKKIYSGTKEFVIKPKKGEMEKFNFKKEKTSDLNIMINSVLNPEDNYIVENQKIKLSWSRIFIDLKGKNNVALIIDSQYFESQNMVWDDDQNLTFDMWKLKATKFVKSYWSIYFYIFFEHTYLKFDVVNVKMIMN